MDNLNDKKVINQYINFYNNTEGKINKDCSKNNLIDDLNECDAESSNDEKMMLENNKLCAVYSKNLNESVKNNKHHSEAWKKLALTSNYKM